MAYLQAETCSMDVKAQSELRSSRVVFEWTDVVDLVINTTEWLLSRYELIGEEAFGSLQLSPNAPRLLLVSL
jgi:hypothetical protein